MRCDFDLLEGNRGGAAAPFDFLPEGSPDVWVVKIGKVLGPAGEAANDVGRVHDNCNERLEGVAEDLADRSEFGAGNGLGPRDRNG